VIRPIARIATAVAVVVAVSAFTAPARHVALKKSNPAANDTLAQSPAALQLWFNEKVELGVVTVKLADAKGVATPLGALKQEVGADAPITAAVTKPLAAGAYSISWSVAGKDGHPTQGKVPFVVKAAH
jgi:methionine-rich copper-binding protein CopC